MNRSIARNLVLAAGLGLSLTSGAMAQTLTYSQPAIGTRELVSIDSNLLLTGTGFSNTTAITGTIQVFTVTAGNTVANVGGAITIPAASAFDTNNDGTANANPQTTGGGAFPGTGNTLGIILDAVTNLDSTLNTAANQVGTGTGAAQVVAYGIQISITAGTTATTTNPTSVTVPSGLTVSNANTERVTFNAAATSPQATTTIATFTDGRVQTVGTDTQITLIANRPLFSQNTAPGTSVNLSQSAVDGATPPVATAVSADADVRFDDNSGFTSPQFVGTTGGTVTVIGPSNNALRIVIPTANLNSGFGAGQFIGATGTDLRDYIGRALSGDTDGILLQSVGTFTVSSVELLQDAPNGTPVSEAIRVVFSAPLSDAGDVNSYRLFDSTSTTGNSLNYTINAVNIDPNNPAAVLLNITANGGDGYATDGRTFNSGGAATGAIRVQVNDDQGNDPTSLFGAEFTGDVLTAGTDFIAPELSNLSLAYVDTNRDGAQDGVVLSFSEPIQDITAATGFQLTRNAIGGIRPAFLVTAATPELPDAVSSVLSGTIANNVITPAAGAFSVPATGTGVSRIDFDINADGTIQDRERNAALLFTYNPTTIDWDNDGTTRPADANEAVPDTGANGAVSLFFNPTTAAATNALSGQSVATVSVLDAAGRVFSTSATITDASDADRAAPALLALVRSTGDNQDSSDDDQLFEERDGNVGDQANNDRLTYVFGESLNFGFAFRGGSLSQTVQQQFRFGAGGTQGFVNDPIHNNPSNVLAFENSQSNPAITSGVVGSILPGSDVSDNEGNEVRTLADRASTDRFAPYVALVQPVDQGSAVDGAFLFDADNDNFADSIRLTTNQPVNNATVALSDFSLSLGTATAVAVQGNDIVLTLTDGAVPMSSLVTVTYNGSSDASLIASTGGVPVDNTNISLTARQTPTPDSDTQDIAIMDIVGVIRSNGNPVPVGTKIYAMIAVPTAVSATSTHNNTTFTVDYRRSNDDTANDSGAGDSLDAFTNVILGLEDELYLTRNEFNEQDYQNNKYFGSIESDNDEGDFARDVIGLTLNTSSLSNITFTGRGETTNQSVTNGRVTLAWDVLRSGSGTLTSLYQDGFRSYYNNGRPILSSAVVTGNDGRYELHVSAPSPLFTGNNRLSGVDRPVILVVETPGGERFAVSSLLSSVNGAPVLFSVQNRTQQASGGQASNARVFDINLNNVGRERIFDGWNLVPFNRQGGWAATSGARPVRVSELDESEIVVPTSATPVPLGASAVEQFVFWIDNTSDGRWLREDDDSDGTFDSIVIDSDLYRFFFFTMGSTGIQIGSGINNLVGGYALGAFNDGYWSASYGVFQFGAPFTNNILFPGTTSANTFPNNSTTQGWGLFSTKTGYSPATTARGSGTNPDLDYIFYFRNNGSTASSLGLNTIEVQSLDLVTETTETDPQDLTTLPAGQAFFGHFQP